MRHKASAASDANPADIEAQPARNGRNSNGRSQLRLRFEDDPEAACAQSVAFRVRDATERRSKAAVRIVGECYAEMG